MIDFRGLPKQWLLCRSDPGRVQGAGPVVKFAGLHVVRAPGVPLVTFRPVKGPDALAIGWVIYGDVLHREDVQIDLSPGQSIENLFSTLGGRFVLIAHEGENLMLREDATGNLPACYMPKTGIVASTPAALARLVSLAQDPEIEAVFAFPKSRGFMPFGLTPYRDVFRVTANHALNMASMDTARIWPVSPPDRLAEDDKETKLSEIDKKLSDLKILVAAQ